MCGSGHDPNEHHGLRWITWVQPGESGRMAGVALLSVSCKEQGLRITVVWLS